jgi:hypothetical protein
MFMCMNVAIHGVGFHMTLLSSLGFGLAIMSTSGLFLGRMFLVGLFMRFMLHLFIKKNKEKFDLKIKMNNKIRF